MTMNQNSGRDRHVRLLVVRLGIEEVVVFVLDVLRHCGPPSQRSLADGLFDPRLVNRDDGLSLQLPDERGQPETADAEEGGER